MAGRNLNRWELRKQAAGSKTVADEQSEDILIADKRAGLSPADIVEQRFRVLLHSSALSVGEPKEGASRREANLGQGESIVYAVSIEQSHAAEILAQLLPWPCRFWQTDYRGLLLIHGRTPKPAKGVRASDQGSGANALLGVVELLDCIPSAHPDGDPDEVEYHWLLANPRTLVQPLPYPGRLGLFLVSERVVDAVQRQLGMS